MRTIVGIESVSFGSPPSEGPNGVEITTEGHGVFYAVDYGAAQLVPDTDVWIGRWCVFMHIEGKAYDAGPCVCDGESLAGVLGVLLRGDDLRCHCGTGVVFAESGLRDCGACAGGHREQADVYAESALEHVEAAS